MAFLVSLARANVCQEGPESKLMTHGKIGRMFAPSPPLCYNRDEC